MTAYSEYKATGLQWLPQIPKHWKIHRTKSIFRLVTESAPPNNDYELLSVYTHIGVRPRRTLEAKGNRASTTDGYWLVKRGDIICNKLLAWMGAIGVSHFDGVTSPAYDIIRKRDSNTDENYYHYLFRISLYHSIFRAYSRGIMDMRLRLYFDQFGSIPIPIPPEGEQVQIVRYLDAMTAKINKLIRAKKKQIALLQEQKQAIINQAVTQGLDPNVEMKDSGIDWLGKIPKHWKIRPLKFYANSNQKSLSGTMDENFSFRYLEISSVGFGFIKKEPETFFFKAAPSRARRIVQQGDTIISTVRTYLRSMCFIDESIADCIVSTGFSVLTPKKEVLPVLLSYALNTDYFVNEVIRNSIGISYPAISDSKLLSLKLALPDTLEEQKEIFRHIKQKTSDIDQEIEQLGKTINKINEYKNSLVSAVVTGKMDIRGLTVEDVVPVAEDVTIDDEEAGEDVEEEMTEAESED